MSTDLARRRVCVGASAACAALIGAIIAPRARAQVVTADHGRVVPPVPIPDIPVRRADGRLVTLAGLMQGYATALHLIFTGCSTVCPIQGAIFQRLQSLLTDQRERRIQLVSLSIDPLADTPSALRAWLARYDAHDGWFAVAPRPADLNQVLELFGQGRNAVESHVTQVNIIDRRGNLVFKTQQLPSADSIAELLRQVS
jgi:protein SCO1/2